MKTLQLLAFLFVFLSYSCQNNRKMNTTTKASDCIESVLAEDNELGKKRNHECEKIDLHQTITNYINAMQDLNFDDCPEAFTNAFKDHISAWKNMGEFTKKYPDLRGEMHVLFDSIEKTKDSTQFKALLKPIWDTWTDVEAAKPNTEHELN